MKTVTLILFAAAILAAQNRPAKEAPAKPDASSPAASPSIPPGAVQIEPYLYRYTDSKGKTWMYRRTPFGLSKWEDKPETQPVVEETNPIVATDLGDSVRFEAKTPFGPQVWVRKKAELSPEESAILARRKSGPAPSSERKTPATSQTAETK